MATTATSTAAPVAAPAGRPGRGRPAPARVVRAGEVLDLVRRGQATTISGLSSAMGMARSTVTERVEALVSLGMLRESDDLAGGRGRPATTYRFDPSAGVVLGAQIGMSGMRVAVGDLAGDILATRSVDVAIGRGPETVLRLLEGELDLAMAEVGRTRADVMGVGVGVPGRIELETASDVGTGTSRPWLDYPLEDRLARAFGVPVVLDRGVALLTIAEHRAVYPDAAVVLGVKVGTVVECGVVVGGRVVGGGSGLAGEIGHTAVAGHDVRCVCGNQGCLNAVAGGAALVSALQAQGLEVSSARDVAALALRGVVPAAQAVRESGRLVGEVVAGAVNLLNPDVVVVWGYLADAGDQLFAGLRESLYRLGVPAATQHVRVEPATLGDDAGIRGAVTTAVEEVLLPHRVDAHVLRALTAR